MTRLFWELLHPHGQGDTSTLSSAAGRFLECRCSYSNPHISKVTTQKCYLKSYPLFTPRTTQRQISVHSLQSQTLKGHCCSTSSQYTSTVAPPTQPGWFSLWLSNPAGHSHEYCNPTDTGKLQAISVFSCKIFLVWVASLPQKKGNCFQWVFSPKSNILI